MHAANLTSKRRRRDGVPDSPPGRVHRFAERKNADGAFGQTIYCLAGADYPSDIRLLRAAFDVAVPTASSLVLNDTFAALRAGSTRPWGIALICGQGINGAAVAPTGRRFRFAGVGDISGDWGGGTSIGQAGLGAAVRARDGRGPRTEPTCAARNTRLPTRPA